MSFMPDSDSEDELPPGWKEKVTDGGAVCYINEVNNTTQWTHPRTGRMKHVDGALPIGWEKEVDLRNNTMIFHNKKTNQTTTVDPRLAFAKENALRDISQVRQRYDASTTALQILHGKDLNGRLALITGANAGIGYETARSLVLHGCEVVFACRNRAATEEAIEKIVKERPVARGLCRFIELDLSSLKSVCKFIIEVRQSVKHINFLILNASVTGLPLTLTEDGLEITFQVSHLSHFYLTNQLENLFDHTTRIVVVASESHRFANLPAEQLTENHLSLPPEKYWNMIAYNNAKLCNVLFAQALAERWKHKGISVFSLHPGNMVSTKLQRNWWFYRMLFAVVRPFTKSLQQAAATTVYCATADELTGLTGLYFNNCYFCKASKLSQNQSLQLQLWKLSEEIVERILNTLPKAQA